MIKTARPFFRDKKLILKALDTVLESCRLIDGEITETFENEFAKYISYFSVAERNFESTDNPPAYCVISNRDVKQVVSGLGADLCE